MLDTHDEEAHCFHTADARREIFFSAKRRGKRRMIVCRRDNGEVLSEERIDVEDAKKKMEEGARNGWRQVY